MKIIGKWLLQVDTDEGRAEFKETYGMDFYEYMILYQVTHITRIFLPNIRGIEHIAFLEYDGSVNQIFLLEAGEHLMVYSSGCQAEEGCVFNTDGMAFMTLVRDGKRIATWCVENSPYDVTEDEFAEELGIFEAEIIQSIKNSFKENSIDLPVNNNVLYVRQL